MHARWLTATVLVLVPCAWASTQEKEEVSLQEVIAELRALRAEVAELTEKVEELETQIGRPAKEGAAAGDDVGLMPGLSWKGPWADQRRDADREALRKIKLPDNATREQVRNYIDEIVILSRGQNSFSSDDPQIRMLAAVGPENLDLLLDASDETFISDIYVMPAIVGLARDEHKDMIIEALPYYHGLARVILRRRWYVDARGPLLDGLRNDEARLPTEWIQAVAALRDPETYELLTDYLVHGNDRRSTYQAIERLPGIALEQAVADAWEQAKLASHWEAFRMAEVAIAYGHVDALGYLIESQSDVVANRWGFPGGTRRTIWRYTHVGGNIRELADWFGEDEDKLVFDPKRRLFVVPEAAPAPAQSPEATAPKATP